MKGNIFPKAILSRLSDVLKETEKGAYRSSHVFAKYLFYPYNFNQPFRVLHRPPNVRSITESLSGLFCIRARIECPDADRPANNPTNCVNGTRIRPHVIHHGCHLRSACNVAGVACPSPSCEHSSFVELFVSNPKWLFG